ncbi:MAG: hypothetical protein WAW75_10150 [Gallionella sp.]
MKRTATLELYLNCSSDYSISGNDGQKYTVEEARALWLAHKVADFNLGFKRLVDYDFDLARVKEYFNRA